MKIALLDLNHATRGVHNNTAPLGLGLIKKYLTITIDHNFDIRIFKDTDKALDTLSSWVPDVLGIAQYSWNSELNLSMAAWFKKNHPGCMVIAGGPNFDISGPGREEFFKRHPFVDFFILYDGEIPFAQIVQRALEGESIASLRKDPVPGSCSYDHAEGKMIDSAGKPPRLDSLDVFGPLYSEGIFNEFLDEGYHPFLQTHRGCPFTCDFCHTSDRYYSRMLFLSADIFRREMEYLGEKFAGRHDVVLYLANTNMSLFREDFAIAGIIRDIQQKFDWPKIINVNSGKDPGKLLEMLSIVRFMPAIALQTLTPSVLKNINRKNISMEDFISFQRNVSKETGEFSSTELILCLPGETKASFLETVGRVINSGVQNIVVYTLMYLKGTPLASLENAAKYGYTVRHRVVPRQFSLVLGEKVLDTEEVVVATNTMSFEDYLELRGLCFTISSFFSSVELVPLKKFLIECGVDISQWVLGMHERLSEFNDIKRYYQEFINDTNSELFLTREDLLKYFDDPKNWLALCEGQYGDNLLRKYKQLVLSRCYKSVLELAFSVAQGLVLDKAVFKGIDVLLEDMKLYLSTRDVGNIFHDARVFEDRTVRLRYDIPLWLAGSEGSGFLSKLSGEFFYTLTFDAGVKEKAQEFSSMNKDKDLSLQILYRDGNIREFWPRWFPVGESLKTSIT